MTNFVENEDWITDEGFSPPDGAGATHQDNSAPASTFNSDDFGIPDFEVAEMGDAPIGDNFLEIVGFRSDPKKVTKSGYVSGSPVSYLVGAVNVKFGVVGRLGLEVEDYMEFPIGTAKDVACFMKASKTSESKAAGFMYKKFIDFLKKVGYPVVDGQPIPAQARNLSNWVGKRVHATVQEGREQTDQATGLPKCNPSTGEPYPVKPEIKLFSYREAEETVVARAAAQAPVAPIAKPAGPARPQGAGQPFSRPEPVTADQFVQSGLAGLVAGGPRNL